MIRTPRLVLRPWRDADLPAFAEQNADPVVMRFLSGVLTREESDAYVARAKKHLADGCVYEFRPTCADEFWPTSR